MVWVAGLQLRKRCRLHIHRCITAMLGILDLWDNEAQRASQVVRTLLRHDRLGIWGLSAGGTRPDSHKDANCRFVISRTQQAVRTLLRHSCLGFRGLSAGKDNSTMGSSVLTSS